MHPLMPAHPGPVPASWDTLAAGSSQAEFPDFNSCTFRKRPQCLIVLPQEWQMPEAWV